MIYGAETCLRNGKDKSFPTVPFLAIVLSTPSYYLEGYFAVCCGDHLGFNFGDQLRMGIICGLGIICGVYRSEHRQYTFE